MLLVPFAAAEAAGPGSGTPAPGPILVKQQVLRAQADVVGRLANDAGYITAFGDRLAVSGWARRCPDRAARSPAAPPR
ncbi:hypothetical protein [Streptomyces sp. NPDC005828]|uniref:hypothetical protein n=1 Tax=Streptomyces sp. NPDC005828 TaxID=3157071 RepID=UPI0033CC87C6